MATLPILFEDNHLLVVDKPAGIATMGAQSGPSVHSMAAQYLKETYHKPGRVFVGIVSRLDAMTTGVMVLARTSKAASRLVPQFADKAGGGAQKIYLAAVEGSLDLSEGEFCDHLFKDDAARRMRITHRSDRGASEAKLRYMTVARTQDTTIVAVQLYSGRKHQIRVQFADRGHAVIGDRKYGSKRAFSAGIALHSWRLQITHPTLGKSMWFAAQLPKTWKPWARVLPQPDKLWDQVKPYFDLPVQDD